MGKNARIQELEQEVRRMRSQLARGDDVRDFIKTLAEMPEDAVLTYQITGQRISHQIGLAARVLLAKLNDA